MKKLTLVAVAVAASSAFAANAANIYSQDGLTVDLGGRVQAASEYDNNGTTNQRDGSYSRVNLTIASKVNDTLTAKGFVEQQYNLSDANGTRYVYAALTDGTNEVQFGKADGSTGQVSDFTDILKNFSNQATYQVDSSAWHTANQTRYVGSFDNLTVNANYNAGGDAVKYTLDGSSKSATIKQGFGASAVYTLGDTGLNFGLAYAKEKYVHADSSQNIMASTSYTTGDLYFAGLVSKSELFGEKVTGYEATAKYTINDMFNTAAVLSRRETAVNTNILSGDFEVNLTSNVTAWVAAYKELNQGKDAKGELGARVSF